MPRSIYFVCRSLSSSPAVPNVPSWAFRAFLPLSTGQRTTRPRFFGLGAPSPSARRTLHTTPLRLKQKKKNEPQPTTEVAAISASAPFDFADLQESLAAAHERLRSIVRQVKPGGQLGQENIEGVRVKLKGSTEGVRLSDLAQVVPKGGRTIAIMVGEQEHVKYVTSAVLSQLEVNPVPSTYDPLELHVGVPSPTQESRKKAQKQVTDAAEKAKQAVQAARAVQQKKHRTLDLSKKFRPDDLHKAGKEMEKLVEKGNEEVKSIVDAAKKAMER